MEAIVILIKPSCGGILNALSGCVGSEPMSSRVLCTLSYLFYYKVYPLV